MNTLLCGLPGSGKSTVAKLLKKEIIEIDALIEKKEGLKCRQIFSEKGAAYFRDVEHQVLEDLAKHPPKNAVISLGGGSLEREDNLPLIQSLGIIYYLKVDLKTSFERITRKGIPSYLDTSDPFGSFEKIAAFRTPVYQHISDVIIEADLLTPEQIAQRVNLPIYLGAKPLIKILKSFGCSQYAIITDTTVAPLHGESLKNRMNEERLNTTLIVFPAGEEHKTRATKEYCENQLLKLKAGRDTCVIGLGGGVVTDLAGFVAATYCRGVPAVMIPTTLLGMVDASIGGKTGVNTPEGKNLIGTITQPQAIFIDSKFLKTLPLDEIKNGISEIIKHSLIADRSYFNFLKSHAKKILSLDAVLMDKAIWESVLIKTSIVTEDENENGKRRLLNFGHTVAHAIETATKHAISHGRAVAIGTLAESELSMKTGHLSPADFKEIQEIFKTFEIDLTWKNPLDQKSFLDFMKQDKKSLSKIPRFVLLKEIGKPLEFNGQYCTSVEPSLINLILI